MKLLKLTAPDGITALVDVSDAVTIQRRYDDQTRTEIVWKERHLFIAVRETPDEIAAMLAEEPPQKSALEAAAPQMLEALKSLFDESISHAESRKIVRAAITKAEGRS